MEYETMRRLYRGAGNFIEPGETASFEKHEAEPLLRSGAIREMKKEPAPENKMEPAPENKAARAPANKAKGK